MKKTMGRFLFYISNKIAGTCVTKISVESGGQVLNRYFAGLNSVKNILEQYNELVLEMGCYKYDYEIHFKMKKGIFNGASFIVKNHVDLLKENEPKVNIFNKLK